jgi:asparagine synthetase B (glutamine-hydrolysing)
MCSFLILLDKVCNNIHDLNKLLKLRGPDKTNTLIKNNYIFLHNLLHICGELTLQPFIKDNIVCLFNGEIYNYKEFGNYNSDGKCLIELYQKYDQEFVKKLDGEFAIVIFDFNKNIVILSSDIFSTKPLFYCYDNGFMICSFKSVLKNLTNKEILKLSNNTCIKFNLNGEIIKTIDVYNFCTKQYKNNFDDWEKAFVKSILKRTNTTKEIFITLSSGYDSGCIDLVLKNNKINFKSYTIKAAEKVETIKKRNNFIRNNNMFIELYKDEYQESRDYINKNMDENITKIKTTNLKQYPTGYSNLSNITWASAGLNHIFKIAKKENKIIYLSGQGPDEIMGDYGFNKKPFKHFSEINGYFPSDLSKIFPWNNFFNGTMRAFIDKEEATSSLHGIEGRYPYLDKEVVQEYLWLSNDLKNKNYKAPLYYLMKKYKYSFDKNVKIGFKCKRNLKK